MADFSLGDPILGTSNPKADFIKLAADVRLLGGGSAGARPIDPTVQRFHWNGTTWDYHDDSDWVDLGSAPAKANKDMEGHQLLNFLLEKLGSTAVDAITREAEIAYETAVGRAVLRGAAKTHYLATAARDGTTIKRIALRPSVASLTNKATEHTVIPGWLLDASAEELRLVAEAPIPPAFTGSHDVEVKHLVAIAVAETADDDIDIEGELRVIRPGADAADKASTTLASVMHDIGSHNAQYAVHEVVQEISAASVQAGDLIDLTLGRNALSQVAGIIVMQSCIEVPVFNLDG